MTGECTYRHHEEFRLKLYHTENETSPIPLKYVDAVRQTQTSVFNISEHIIKGSWNEAKEVNLSVEWTGSTRFQIPRTRVLEGYKWFFGRPTKIQKTTSQSENGFKLGHKYQRNKKNQKLQNGQNKMSNSKQHAATQESTRH